MTELQRSGERRMLAALREAPAEASGLRREPQHSPQRTRGNSGKRLGSCAKQRVLVFDMWDCSRRPDVSLVGPIRCRKARNELDIARTDPRCP